MTILLIFMLLTSIKCNFNESSAIKPQGTFDEVDSLIYSAISDSTFPGAVLLVNKSGKIIFNKAYGRFTYADTSSAVTTETIFDIASLTKVIATTTAAMICYEKELFSLDDPVSKFIPSFAAQGKANITIKNLLLHNSGLPAFKRFYKKYSLPDEIINDIYLTELEYETGTKTVYSDLGMIVLAKVIEKVTGESLDVLCRKEIFQPLDMRSTLFNPPDSIQYKINPTEIDNYWRNKLVWGKVHDETASMLDGVAGHAGLFTTADNINKLLRSLLSQATNNGINLVKKQTVELFTKKFSEESTRALGWDTKSAENSSAGNLFDITSFGHTGFTGTSVWIDPTKDLIVVFLPNRVYPTRENKKIYKLRPVLHDAVVRTTN
jgi:CubicO group peptidase (beta-lactamase class C family)